MAKYEWIDDVEHLLRETMSYFYPSDTSPSIWKFTKCLSGVNNVVYHVDYVADAQDHPPTSLDSSKSYVIRLYNNGRDHDRVKFEHFILRSITQMSSKLPFTIPQPISSRVGVPSTYVQLSNGIYASLFPFINGSTASLEDTEAVGMACAMTSSILRDITQLVPQSMLESCSTRPYYELWKTHPSINKALFDELISSSVYDSIRSELSYLIDELPRMEEKIERFLSMNLPKQIIHGDLQVANILCENGKVTGVLDLEFVAYDWRAMDLAINLSTYCHEINAIDIIDSFMHGYAAYFQLTMMEIECIPDLISLRLLNNVIYYIGRAHAREDTTRSLISRAVNYQKKIIFLHKYREQIVQTIMKHLSAYGNLV
jgi:homoserine kinase type II